MSETQEMHNKEAEENEKYKEVFGSLEPNKNKESKLVLVIQGVILAIALFYQLRKEFKQDKKAEKKK